MLASRSLARLRTCALLLGKPSQSGQSAGVRAVSASASPLPLPVLGPSWGKASPAKLWCPLTQAPSCRKPFNVAVMTTQSDLHSKSAPLLLGADFPDFEVETSQGPLRWHEYIDGSWAVLFSHPADFTPVCTTELGSVAKFLPEFAKRGVKVAALSCDNADTHKAWIKDVEAVTPGPEVLYPIIADPNRDLAVRLGMLDPVAKDAKGLPLTCRAVFIVGPDKKLKLSLLYPATTGRNFNEILRVIDSLQLTANYSVATPVDWKHGEDCVIAPSVSNEAAVEKFPKGFKTVELPSGKGYLRMTPQPNV